MRTTFDTNGYPDVYINNNKMLSFANVEEQPNVIHSGAYDSVDIGGNKMIPWFADNDFPRIAAEKIANTPVLKRALTEKTKIILGQGVFPARIKEILPNGEEVLEVVNDTEIINFFQSYIINRYLSVSCYNYITLANAFVQLIPNIDGSSIARLNPVPAGHCLLADKNKDGRIEHVYVSGKFPDAEKKDISKYILLDEIDPYTHLQKLREEGVLKKETVFMHLKSPFSFNDYYAMPAWNSAKEWIKITNKIPIAINSGMDNMLGLLYHIQIPYIYWDRKYPKNEFEGKESEREDLIDADLVRIDKKLTTAKNAKKTLITYFDQENDSDRWQIDVKETKFSLENIVTSTAADTQIAIAAGINPDLLGLMYGNSKAGSMQRELLLIAYALSWNARQKLADPLEIMLRFNYGDKYNDVQIRFRNTFLTKLDDNKSGKETQLS